MDVSQRTVNLSGVVIDLTVFPFERLRRDFRMHNVQYSVLHNNINLTKTLHVDL